MTWLAGVVLLLTIALFVGAAGTFAGFQAVWVDETTQLSGLALPLGQQLGWLAGWSGLDLGVPPDRMPPLSYWGGAIWSGIFGLSELSMRWFGIVTVLAATPALFLAGRTRGGVVGGLFAVAIVLLTPNAVVVAGEIRAYPLFLLLSAWSVWAYLRCLDPLRGGEAGRLALLGLLLILASYSHFFGVVMAAALLFPLLVERLLRGKGFAMALLGTVVILIALTGLFPFLINATQVSAGVGADTGGSLSQTLRSLVQLAFRIFLHGSHLVWPMVLAIVAGSLLGLFVLAVANIAVQGADRSNRAGSTFLILPLLLAGLVLPILDLRIGSFSVLAPHYNIWMVPLLAVFMAGAFAPARSAPWQVGLARVLGGVAVAGQIIAVGVLLRHAELYIHGPGEWVTRAWSAGSGETVVIHDEEGEWGQAYFPLHYLSGQKAVQLLARPDGSLWRIVPGRLEPLAADSALNSFDRALRIRVTSMNSSALARVARGEACDPLPHVAATMQPQATFCAFFAASIGEVPVTDR